MNKKHMNPKDYPAFRQILYDFGKYGENAVMLALSDEAYNWRKTMYRRAKVFILKKAVAVFYGGTFIISILILVTASCNDKVPAPATPFDQQLSRNDFELVVGEFEGVNDIIDNYSFRLLRIKNTDTPQKKRLSAFLDSVLYDGLTIDEHLKKEIMTAADMEHESIIDHMDRWYINGKYLCIERSYCFCIAHCTAFTPLYVIDTHLMKRLTLDDIFINPNSPEFENIVMKHIKRHNKRDYNGATLETFKESLKHRSYQISYEKKGVGFHWSWLTGMIGYFDILIPRSKIEPYMTPAGKESSMLDGVVWDSLFNDSITRQYEHTKLPPLRDFFENVVKMAKDGSLYDYSAGEYGKCMVRYKTYLRVYPLSDANVLIYNDIGYYLEQAKAYDAAIFVLSAVVEKYPQRVVAHLNLADAYWGNDEQDNAGKHYEEYVNLMKDQDKDMSKIPQRVYDRIKPAAQ